MYLIKETHPIANKKHTCKICGCSIEIGERYIRQSISDGCKIHYVTCHEVCPEEQKLPF